MIIGIGCDIVDIPRIQRSVQRFGKAFLKRVYTEKEQDNIHGVKEQYLAGRFAAKEACVKALGTGFTQGIQMTDIEIVTDKGGAPALFLYGRARHLADERGITAIHVSISHEKGYALAFVVLEGS